MLLAVISVIVLATYGVFAPRSRLQLTVIALIIGMVLMLSLLHAISNFFTGEGITYAVLVHLLYGVRDGELEVLRFPGLVVLVGAVIGVFLVWAWVALRRLRRQGRQAPSSAFTWALVGMSILLLPMHPAVLELRTLYVESMMRDVPLSQDMKWTAGGVSNAKRSVVYIYLESFERTFLDERLFPGLAPRLRELEAEGAAVHGIVTSPFMNWTMGGMVASQCGMVMTPLTGGSSEERGDYRPGVHCLGDLMRDAGYRLSYIGGADLGFSGKGRFYREHGFDTVIGFDELKAEIGPELPHSEWGAYDDTVFNRARQEFARLKAAGGPFGLFLLTTATHPHSGYPSPSCGNGRFGNPMLDAAHCSDTQVYEFVRWLQEQEREDLLIVVASDHLQVAGDASTLLKRSDRRDNFFLVLGQGILPRVIDRPSTMVDVAPTVAWMLGFGMTEMALGRNLMLPAPTLAERYGSGQFNAMIPQWRVGLDRRGQADSASQ